MSSLTKKIIFIRHGQAEHNVGFDNCGTNAYYDNVYRNSSLTIKGIDQSQHLRSILEMNGLLDIVEAVYTSPLDRAIQTTLNVFHSAKNDTKYIPLIAIEDAREIGYVHPCNERRYLSEIHSLYPEIDTHNIVTERDVLFMIGDTWDRFEGLINVIKNSNYSIVAVVSHESYLLELLNNYLSFTVDHIYNCGYVVLDITK